MRGKILFDDNADRIPDFWIIDLHKGWEQYKDVVFITLAEPIGKVRICHCYLFNVIKHGSNRGL